MDKMSINVLKLLQEYGCPVPRKLIISELGSGASTSIHYLLENGYIKQVMKFGGVKTDPVTGRGVTYDVPTGEFEIAAPGLEFLESLPGKTFDKWMGRMDIILPYLAGLLSARPLRKLLDLLKGLLQQS